jgi:hypothetical protein
MLYVVQSSKHTIRYPIPYSMSYIVDRTSYRLRRVLDTIFATRIVARVQPQYATYRTEKARSVSTIQPLGPDPYQSRLQRAPLPHKPPSTTHSRRCPGAACATEREVGASIFCVGVGLPAGNFVLGIWAEVFFGSIRYARFVSIPVWKSIRFSGTTLARYPDFDTLLDPWLTYYIHTSTYRSTLHSTCVLVVVYKHYAPMYLCTVQCTTYYILSTARLLVL